MDIGVQGYKCWSAPSNAAGAVADGHRPGFSPGRVQRQSDGEGRSPAGLAGDFDPALVLLDNSNSIIGCFRLDFKVVDPGGMAFSGPTSPNFTGYVR
jgi:hypothetical protein